jgi:Caudovirus prohead serine protease
MRSGVLRQASFAFTVARDTIEIEENQDGQDVEHRTLLECAHLYDVCATPQGAYAQTVSGLRSLAASLGQPALAHGDGSLWALLGGQPHQPASGGASDVSRESGGDAEDSKRRATDEEREELRALVASRRGLFKARKAD